MKNEEHHIFRKKNMLFDFARMFTKIVCQKQLFLYYLWLFSNKKIFKNCSKHAPR